MAYGRERGVSSRASASFEDFRYAAAELPSLAARAIRASAAYRDSSLASAYGESTIAASSYRDSNRETSSPTWRDSTACEYTSVKNLNESKYGFWGILARKAKAIFEDDDTTKKFENHGRHQFQAVDTSTGSQEDLTIMENKTADINHETHKLHIRRKGSDQNAQNQATEKSVQHIFL